VRAIQARLLAEVIGVATGRRPPPRDWFDDTGTAEQANKNFLQAKLAGMMRRANPYGRR
jgi:hypothetical protein